MTMKPACATSARMYASDKSSIRLVSGRVARDVSLLVSIVADQMGAKRDGIVIAA